MRSQKRTTDTNSFCIEQQWRLTATEGETDE